MGGPMDLISPQHASEPIHTTLSALRRWGCWTILIENPGPHVLAVIEIQSGPYLEEDNIVRLQDDYGRCEAQ